MMAQVNNDQLLDKINNLNTEGDQMRSKIVRIN